MQRSLAASSIACAQILDQLSSLLQDAERAQISALQQSAVEDQSTRFQIWAGNLGAFRRLPATASLDHRLRESPRIATQIHELLEDLQTSAEDVRGIVLGERPNRRSEPDLETSDDSTNCDECFEHDSTDGCDDPEDDLPDLSEAEEIFESIKDTIASLFRLAVMIRKSTPRDRYARALGGHNPFIEDFDIAHVGHKFEKLDTESSRWLRDRLGKAITQRRQYLRYARDHRYKLGKEPAELWKPVADVPRANLQLPVDLSASQAGKTNISRPATTLADTTASTLFLQEATYADRDFQDDQSQTSFAFSAFDEDDASRLKLPRLSEVAKGQSSFECPFCWTIQTFRREKAWKKHALSDLRPYICTFEDCDMKMFPDRKIWFEHEMKLHRARWQCHFCGQNSFKSAKAFCEHVRSSHGTEGGQDQLDALAEASKQPLTQFTAVDCPCCFKWEGDLRKSNPDIPENEKVFVTAIDLRRHIGSHMQDLALFAIPRGYLEEGEGDAASKASARAASVGNNAASIAVSDTKGSVVSYDSVKDPPMFRNPVDVKQCVQTIEAVMGLPGTAFEEAVISISPALNDTELHEFHSRLKIWPRIEASPKTLFASIAFLVHQGQGEAEKIWFARWRLYSQNSRMWWNLACSLLTSGARFHTRLKAANPDIENDIEGAFEGGRYSPLFCHILKQVAFSGRTNSKTNTTDDEIMNDINSLRSRSASALTTAIDLFTRSNRYLRKFVRLERKRFPESSIFPSPEMSHVESSSFNFDEEDEMYLPYLLGHLFAGATDPVARDANYLHAAFQAYGSHSFHAKDINPIMSEDWQSLIYQILNLHWNKSHLRAVKSMFEDEYSATVESFIEGLYDPTAGRDNMFIPLLMALVNIETGQDMINFSNDAESQVRSTDDISKRRLPTGETSLKVGGELDELTATSELPHEPLLRHSKLSIYQIALLKVIVLRKRSAHQKESTLQNLLRSLEDSDVFAGSDAWLGRLSRYPIFHECPTFLGSIKPYLTLQVYKTGDIILAKSEDATWAGWLIVGRTTYIANYNPNEPTRQGRRQWTTSENALTFGLVGTLLDLPSLSHNVAETPCVVAQIPKADFKRLVREHEQVEQHLTTEEFGTSFAVARECLRIEITFGNPWWYVFDGEGLSTFDLTTATAKVLEAADDPKIIASLARSIGNVLYKPLDLVLRNRNIEAAKLLLESGAEVHSTTIREALDNDDADFVELLLTRPGGAEAANELLRSGDTTYAPKLQTMLKEMQGRVSLVTASSLQAVVEPNKETNAPKPMEEEQPLTESSATKETDETYEPEALEEEEDQDSAAAGSNETGDIDTISEEVESSQTSGHPALAKTTMWASPLASIRQRWGAGVGSTSIEGTEPESPNTHPEADEVDEGVDTQSQVGGIAHAALSVDGAHDLSQPSPNLAPVVKDISPTSPERIPSEFEQESGDVAAQLAPAQSSVPENKTPFSREEFWRAVNAYGQSESNMEGGSDPVTPLLLHFIDRSFAASFLNSYRSRNDDSEFPLVFAISNENLDLVELLLEYGADPKITTSKGDHPVDFTHGSDDEGSAITRELIRHTLLEHGADKVYPSKDWFDLVHEARGSEEGRSQIRQVLEASQDPRRTVNIPSSNGHRALDIAVAVNDVDTVLFLLEYGATSGDPDGLADVLTRSSTDDAIVQALQLHHVTRGRIQRLGKYRKLESSEGSAHDIIQEAEEPVDSEVQTAEHVEEEQVIIDTDLIGRRDGGEPASSALKEGFELS